MMCDFVRELGLTHAEFYMFLRPAIAPRTFTVENDRVHIEDGERTLDIELGAQRYRSIGSLQLPYVEARFTFSGFSETERERFMARFERYFQRGGG
jgi:zona occludens toxin (predicted ATPase)